MPRATGRNAGGVIIDAVTGTATVQSVNAADRTVVLQHPDGSTSTYECGPEVRNFDQIKAGDQVTATVGEELALVLVPGGVVPPSASQASAIVRAPMGAKPGGKMVDTVAFSAKVTGVDAMKREVTLQTVDGQSRTVKVDRISIWPMSIRAMMWACGSPAPLRFQWRREYLELPRQARNKSGSPAVFIGMLPRDGLQCRIETVTAK